MSTTRYIGDLSSSILSYVGLPFIQVVHVIEYITYKWYIHTIDLYLICSVYNKLHFLDQSIIAMVET